jgi:uncharacterized membrane protein
MGLSKESIPLSRRVESTNKNEFLTDLTRGLSGLPQAEKDDILYDYEEHFSIGREEGKTENDICEALGDPKNIAKQYKAGWMVKKAEENKSVGNIVRAVVAALSLGLFNLIFMVGPFMAIVGILIGLFGTGLGITIAGATTFIVIIFSWSHFIPWATAIPAEAGMLFSIGTTCLGLLVLIGSFYLGKLLYNMTIAYLKMNIKIIAR